MKVGLCRPMPAIAVLHALPQWFGWNKATGGGEVRGGRQFRGFTARAGTSGQTTRMELSCDKTLKASRRSDVNHSLQKFYKRGLTKINIVLSAFGWERGNLFFWGGCSSKAAFMQHWSARYSRDSFTTAKFVHACIGVPRISQRSRSSCFLKGAEPCGLWERSLPVQSRLIRI